MILVALPFVAAAPVGAVPSDLTDRQKMIDTILYQRSIASVVEGRKLCASGVRAESMAALDRAFHSDLSAQLAEECIAYLIRAAREKRRERLSAARAPSAGAVDAGFMEGYTKADTIPPDLPSMAALKPLAQRCFAQTERNTELCSAAGYALGVRAAHGELVKAG